MILGHRFLILTYTCVHFFSFVSFNIYLRRKELYFDLMNDSAADSDKHNYVDVVSSGGGGG